jgi:hypothetical protein
MSNLGFLGPPPALREDARPSVIEAVRFPFQSPDWMRNLLFGMVFVIIPIAGALALYGWMCETMHRLEDRRPQPVPKLEFQDFGHYLGRGIAPFVAALVWGMPRAFLYLVGVALAVAGATLADRLPVWASVSLGLGGGVAFVLGILAGVLTHAATLRAELTERMEEGFAVGKVVGFAKTTWWQVLYRNFLLTCIGMALAMLGYCVFFVGLYAAVVVLMLATMHLRWQIYRYWIARGGEAIAGKPPVELPSEAPPVRPYNAPGTWR